MLILDFALNQPSYGVVFDTYGLGHVGICTDTTIVTDPESTFAQSMSFNGSTSKVSVANIVCPFDFTIAVWLKRGPNLSYYYSTIVAFGNDLPFFGCNNGRPVLANSLSTDHFLDSSWNHVVAMQDAKGSRIYVNGRLVGSSTSRVRTGGQGMVIGFNPGRRNAWFQGRIASVSLFDEALAEADLVRLMLAPPTLENPPTPVLVDESKLTPVPTILDVCPMEAEIIAVPVVDVVITEDDIPEEQIENQPSDIAIIGWNFECKLDIEGETLGFRVFVASVNKVEAAHFQEEVTFSVEVFGTSRLLTVRHRTRISCAEDYSRIFEEHALAEFENQVWHAHHIQNRFVGSALEWLREKIEHIE